jgi:hypothetical protein
MNSSALLGSSIKMKREYSLGFSRRHRLLCGLAAALALIPCTAKPSPPSDAFTTTAAYVTTFYPLWFTYYQSQLTTTNRLAGPERISSLYHIVVAINDDTLYASTFLDLTNQPAIVTIPSATVFPNTTVTYSILTLDPYGTVYELLPGQTAGTFGLTGPGFTGTLPANVIPVSMPLNHMILIFRIDKYSSTNVNQIGAAQVFRATLRCATLSEYQNDPAGGNTLIVPEALTAEPFKTVADGLIADDPINYLRKLQVAVAAPNTPPLSTNDQALSNHFNELFGNGNVGNDSDFAAGARAALSAILDSYLSHLGTTNWIHFTNMGHWGRNVLDRAAITEFIQYGNDISTAAYYQTFRDGSGEALSGGNQHVYVLTFPANQIPQAERFWSVTAYTPEAIELIENPSKKYEVASYTRGLQFNPDQSLSIFMSQVRPAGVPFANWLPVGNRRFNIMLRIYGVVPGSPIANNTYVPPAVVRNP